MLSYLSKKFDFFSKKGLTNSNRFVDYFSLYPKTTNMSSNDEIIPQPTATRRSILFYRKEKSTMINPLIITRKENAGLFRKVCHELGATQRELVAEEWSLSLFLKSDLKNYTFQSHYILDISAVKEKGDDFISLCEGITYQKDNANIIIYADQSYPGDSFLDKLVHCGFTNIVANYTDVDEKTNLTQMTEDLKECLSSGLSKQKWRRFDKSFDAFAESR